MQPYLITGVGFCLNSIPENRRKDVFDKAQQMIEEDDPGWCIYHVEGLNLNDPEALGWVSIMVPIPSRQSGIEGLDPFGEKALALNAGSTVPPLPDMSGKVQFLRKWRIDLEGITLRWMITVYEA